MKKEGAGEGGMGRREEEWRGEQIGGEGWWRGERRITKMRGRSDKLLTC